MPIETLYRLLRKRFGHQCWWPAETPLEVCVGAILVQNTAWTGAERAISRLKRAGALRSAQALHAVPVPTLEQWIRPAGIFRVKAHRLRLFLDYLLTRHGGSVDDALRGPPGLSGNDCCPSRESDRKRRTACCCTLAGRAASWWMPMRDGFSAATDGWTPG